MASYYYKNILTCQTPEIPGPHLKICHSNKCPSTCRNCKVNAALRGASKAL
ncbi:hypothetical protein I79_021752 [Cricetulus griseus]|uniref:Uncharacterized protein n=1 Tax=Cricetulus griseus TaxID=10029 RepID=G3IDH2_CRIGR|nr:hypothetical protein I79_021752 [Cricetulus griseus]